MLLAALDETRAAAGRLRGGKHAPVLAPATFTIVRAALDLAEATVDDEEDIDRLAAAVGKLEKGLDTLWGKLEVNGGVGAR